MSGHSKWNNIQGRKNAQDAKRGKIFQKMSREIYMAAKAGGPDPSVNPALRLVVDKAKAANMPNDNVDRAIKRLLRQVKGNITMRSLTKGMVRGRCYLSPCAYRQSQSNRY